RVRLQGRHGISGRERVEFALADRLKNVLEFRRRDFSKSVRKRARKYGNILRVRSERLAEVVVISISRLIDLVGSDQIICIFVFVEKFERTCQINAGHIVLPRVGDRKSTRLNSSHEWISYAVFCLQKKDMRQES